MNDPDSPASGGQGEHASVDVLLATFQGAPFLSAQLDSLLAQTFQGFRILVRDDGSSDGTRQMLRDWAAAHPGRMTILPDDGQRLRASGSFACLLGESRAPYVMFCDQDDVWLPDKIAVTLAAMRELERAHGRHTPALVNTDLKVVDSELRVTSESLWRYQRIHPERLRRLSRVLIQNFATGCTVMINRALADLALPIPAEAMMHDWWLALVATRFGRACSLDQPTILYRQHDRNDIGARRWSFVTGVENLLLYPDRRRAAVAAQEAVYLGLERQALAFARRFSTRLSPDELAMIGAFAEFRRRGFLGRRYLMVRHRFLQSDRWQILIGLLR